MLYSAVDEKVGVDVDNESLSDQEELDSVYDIILWNNIVSDIRTASVLVRRLIILFHGLFKSLINLYGSGECFCSQLRIASLLGVRLSGWKSF